MLLVITLSSLRLLLKMNVTYPFPLHLTSPAEHQVYSARILTLFQGFAHILTLFQGFSPRILTSFEVWIPLRRCSMLTPGLENQYPPLHTSEANIKKNKLNHNTVKRSQQRKNQPVIRAALVVLNEEEKRRIWLNPVKLLRSLQPNFLFSLVTQLFVFECKHPFIDNPMVITEPAVPSARLLLGLGHREQRSYLRWQVKQKFLC